MNKSRSVYIYEFSSIDFMSNRKFSVDFYNGKGKGKQYVNARSHWVNKLRSIMRYAGNGTYVERKTK